MTGTRLAYLFAQQNAITHDDDDDDDDGDGDGEGGDAKVLYCGPSNKAVDVVTSNYFPFRYIKLCSTFLCQTT